MCKLLYNLQIPDNRFSKVIAYLLSYLYSYISPFMMYCLRYLLLFTCKHRHKYDQSLSIVETYSFMFTCGFLFELWVSNVNEEEKKMNSAHHSPIHLRWVEPWLASSPGPTHEGRGPDIHCLHMHDTLTMGVVKNVIKHMYRK